MKHEEWLVKYGESKQDKIFDLLYELRSIQSAQKGYDKLSYLAAALSISAKGTKLEADVKEIIKMIYPEYYDQ